MKISFAAIRSGGRHSVGLHCWNLEFIAHSSSALTLRKTAQ
jgi:hypothetical protein